MSLTVLAVILLGGFAFAQSADAGRVKNNRLVTYVFKGASLGGSVVEVSGGNSYVRRQGFVGEYVWFNFANSQYRTADINGDGLRSIADITRRARIEVRARLGVRDPGPIPFVAQLATNIRNPR